MSKGDNKMDDGELLSIVLSHLDSASTSYYTQIQEDREKAMEYYLQQPYGNECEGRSSVVTSEVADAINWMLPGLMRTFTSTDKIAVFDPSGPEDEEAAAQETDYINHVFYKECGGFKVLYDWFSDALLQKNGVVKVGYDKSEVVTHEMYEGLTQDEFMLLASQKDLEVNDYEMEEEGGLIEASFTRTQENGKPFVEVLPPEEFRIDPEYEHLSLQDVPFACHETLKLRTELVEAGFDKKLIDGLNSHYDIETQEAKAARNSDLGGYDNRLVGSSDSSMDNILVSDCYVRVDTDGDGIAELRRIVVFNEDEIALNEEIACIPFVSITPVPMAHRFYGRSVADQTMDIQLQKSTLLRNIMDNIYLTNNQEKIVLDGGANLDDLLTSRPGGIKREYIQGAIRPMPVTPFTGHPYQMLEYFDSMKENRTGVTKYNQGMDSESLNQTATGVNKIMSASQSRMELIARLFADGIKDLLVQLHGVLLRNQDKEKIVKLRGKYIPIDPTEWRERTAMTVNVGLGTSDPSQQLQQLQMILGMQMQVMGQGMSNPQLIYNTYSKLVEAAGLKTPELYFTPPEQQPPAPPEGKQQDPQTQALMMTAQAQMQKNQVEQEKNQMSYKNEQQRLQIDARQVAIKEYEAGTKQMTAEANVQAAGIKADMDQQKMNEEIQRDMESMYEAQMQEQIQQQQIQQQQQMQQQAQQQQQPQGGPPNA